MLSSLGTWADVTQILSFVVAIIGVLVTAVKTFKLRKHPAIQVELAFDLRLTNQVARILLDRLIHKRSLGARDLLWIMLAVAADIGVRVPRSLALIRPSLLEILEQTMLLAETTTDLSVPMKERIITALAQLIDDVSNWEVLPPGTIREWNRHNWIILLGFSGLVTWVLVITAPPWSFLWVLIGIVFYLLLDFEHYSLDKQAARPSSNAEDISRRLIDAAQVSDVVDVDEHLCVSTLAE